MLFILRCQEKESFRELWKGFCIKIRPDVSNDVPPPPRAFTRAFSSPVSLENAILALGLNIFHFTAAEFRPLAQAQTI